MLNTGDFAFDTVAGANVQILERIEMWGIHFLQGIQSRNRPCV